MLTKQDETRVEEIVTKVVRAEIKAALQDFYDSLLEPHVTQSEQQHKLMMKDIHETKEDIKKIERNIRAIRGDILELEETDEDHEERITKIEMVVKH